MFGGGTTFLPLLKRCRGYKGVRAAAQECKSPFAFSFCCKDQYGFPFQSCSYCARSVALAPLQALL